MSASPTGHELAAEFAPVRSALCFLNKCQTNRLSRAMWMIDDPHVRVEMVTLHDMLTLCPEYSDFQGERNPAVFLCKGVPLRIPRSIASSS